MENYYIVDNRIIQTEPMKILKDLQRTVTNGKLKHIRNGGDNIQVTCPEHANGHENRPSCFINITGESAPYLWVHCFTCGYSKPFEVFVASCLDTTVDKAKRWLINNYATDYASETIILPEIEVKKQKNDSEEILDDSILDSLEDNHPYFKKRKLTDEIVEKFELKYDSKDKCVVFPVRDIHGDLIGLTKRKVDYKRFELPRFKNKPIYLLYNVLQERIKNVAVVESQINALYLWSLGIPAICLFGTGTDYQYKLLNKSGISCYTLVFDGDEAGRKGAKRFIENVHGIIDIIEMPDGTDINDFDPEMVKSLFF